MASSSRNELKEYWCQEKLDFCRGDGTNPAHQELAEILAKETGWTDPDFLKKLQDPTTKEGFWNTFYGLWGVAQSQPGFDHKAWLHVVDYIKKLEDRLLETAEPLPLPRPDESPPPSARQS